MRINKINNINFGYNKDYAREVASFLSARKRDSEYAQSILQAEQIANKIEDQLVEMEKSSSKVSTLKFQDLGVFLADLRQIIAYYISISFPTLNYTDTLIKQYLSEIKNTPNLFKREWRINVCEKLKVSAVDKYPEIEKLSLNALDSLQSDKTEGAGDFVDKNKSKHSLNELQKESTLGSNTIERQQHIQKTNDIVVPESCMFLELYSPSVSSPNGFFDVVGMDNIKKRLNEDIIEPVLNPEQAKMDYEEYGITRPRGYLFYGPPGCGKTFIVKALAKQANLELYLLNVSKIGSKFINQTANNLEAAFSFLKKRAVKSNKPVLLFMDEVDSLSSNRSDSTNEENVKTLTTLLRLIEEAKDNNIIILAATNKYNNLDEAFKARFDGQIYFSLPDKNQIVNLLKTLLAARKKGQRLANSDDEINALADALKGHSSRSITFIVDEASKIAKRKDRSEISFEDVMQSINETELQKSDDSDYRKVQYKKNPLGFK